MRPVHERGEKCVTAVAGAKQDGVFAEIQCLSGITGVSINRMLSCERIACLSEVFKNWVRILQFLLLADHISPLIFCRKHYVLDM